MSNLLLFPEWKIENQSVLVRADLNVPIKNQTIIDDFRLQAFLPTVEKLLFQKALIIILSHLDRPQAYDQKLSHAPLVQWFNQNGYQAQLIPYNPDLEKMTSEITKKDSSIKIIDNIRFYPQESLRDLTFAQQLARWGSYYINDAWATMHRTSSTIEILPRFFSLDHRSIGLVVEKELNHLRPVLTSILTPKIAIIGGGKIKDKLLPLEFLIDIFDTILLMPPLSCVFSKALGYSVGSFTCDSNLQKKASIILQKAQLLDKKIFLPVDFSVTHNLKNIADLYERSDLDIRAHENIVSIGSKTLELYKDIIQKAQLAFICGLSGFIDHPETLSPTHALYQSIIKQADYSILAGGDSHAAARYFKIEKDFSFVSTGGSATLNFLAFGTLAGLEALQLARY